MSNEQTTLALCEGVHGKEATAAYAGDVIQMFSRVPVQ